MKKLVPTLAIVGFVALSAVQALATPIPVSHWTMDDNAIVLDSSVYANDGTATRNTSELSIVGKIDGAFLFNGLSDSVEISDSGSLDFGTGSFTIAGWIMTSQIGDQFIRFSGGSDGAGFIFGTNGGQWVHVEFVGKFSGCQGLVFP